MELFAELELFLTLIAASMLLSYKYLKFSLLSYYADPSAITLFKVLFFKALFISFFKLLLSSCTSSFVTSNEIILFFLMSTAATCILRYPFLTFHLWWGSHSPLLLVTCIPVLSNSMIISFPILSLILISSLFTLLFIVL